MSALETHNYYSDPRVIESMRRKMWCIKHSTSREVVIEFDLDFIDSVNERLDQDYKTHYTVPPTFEVCPQCKGSGVVVNPNIDCGGISSEEFYDPAMKEAYLSGDYDISCTRCKGQKVVLDESDVLKHLPPDLVEAITEWENDEAEFLQTQLAELRMGC